jgi:hypothetical protein
MTVINRLDCPDIGTYLLVKDSWLANQIKLFFVCKVIFFPYLPKILFKPSSTKINMKVKNWPHHERSGFWLGGNIIISD